MLDQRRRSRLAACRFEYLYKKWSKEAATSAFLKRLHAAIRALLAKHHPDGLRGALDMPEIDLAIAGGGAKSLYGAGAYIVLQHAGFRMDRMSGASAGAYLAALLVGNRYQVDDLLHENLLGWGDCVVQVIREYRTLLLGQIWRFMSAELTKRLRGWLPRPGELFVSVATVNRFWFSENTVSYFESSEDLERTICASMSIPFFLCDGPAHRWRGQWAVDGGFKNNCPVTVFFSTHASKPAQRPEQASVESIASLQDHGRVVVKIDCNKISTMPAWRKLLHVVYAPADVCGKLILEGMEDMLEILVSGKEQVSGITVIKPGSPMNKRDFSYQLLPGKEHLTRLLSGADVF